MTRKLIMALILTMSLVALLVGTTAAASAKEKMPPDCVMTPEMMVTDIKMWTADLPSGVRSEIVQLLPQLTPEELMTLHHEMHHTGLLDEAPGIILLRVLELAH